MNLVMNDALPRCTVPGSTCRLLQFEASGPRPVWAVLDGAGARRFTGEVTLHIRPIVRAYFQDGELYFAERDGDTNLVQRLTEYGVVSEADLEAGTVRLGPISHLGRLFDRVPTIDRDQVELALEVITGELLGEIADHTVDSTSIATYRHHGSGVNKWLRKPTMSLPVTGPDFAELDRSILADYEATVVSPAAQIAPLITAPPANASVEIVPDPVTPVAAAAAPTASAEVAWPPTAPEWRTPRDADLLVIPDAPSYYTAPSRPVAGPIEPSAEAPAAPVVLAGTITETIWFRDPVLDPEEAAPVESEPAAARSVAEAPVRRSPIIDFDLASVIAAVALEHDGAQVPVTDDCDIDDTVRAAVREALAEIQAATRPRAVDVVSPIAFAHALDTVTTRPVTTGPVTTGANVADSAVPVTDTDPTHADVPEDAQPDRLDAPWLPGRTAAQQASTDGRGASEATGTLRRLIGGARKP